MSGSSFKQQTVGFKGRSSQQIDQLKENELQSSIFRKVEETETVDFRKIEVLLLREGQIPEAVIKSCVRHIQDNLNTLGLDRPKPNLVINWLTGLLNQAGYALGEIPLLSLELTLNDVEQNIFHPVGAGAGSNQNPEATSLKIARRIKSQFAANRVYQRDLIQAHDAGRLEILHMGSADRPHDVFLTPDYLKQEGLPLVRSTPASGPAKKAETLTAHMVRFTHELQNHFAGDIHWGYVNILFLPFLEGRSPNEWEQIAQDLIFEFAQIDVARGGLSRRVILDFDLDIPHYFEGVPVLGPGGKLTGKTYGEYTALLDEFNRILLDVISKGDRRHNPFHAPLIHFHINHSDPKWTTNRQKLLEVAFRLGNPSISFSHRRRDLGAIGFVSVQDPDFLRAIAEPKNLRGFSGSSLAINLPRLCFGQDKQGFENQVDQIFELAVSAHRQKRIFLSRLMAYGNRGPLQFLRHKLGGKPFLKIDLANQPIHIVGLGEAAALLNGAPKPRPEVLADTANYILSLFQDRIQALNRLHKLNMRLCGTRHESVAYRFAFLDLKKYGQEMAPFVLHQEGQSHPIYTEGANILAFSQTNWRNRIELEGQLHHYFQGFHPGLLFLSGSGGDPSFVQKVFNQARSHGWEHLMPAPDFHMCMNCHQIFSDTKDAPSCPNQDCRSVQTSPYGFCQAHFSPVNTWCMGKRAEWRIRKRIDVFDIPFQAQLPI